MKKNILISGVLEEFGNNLVKGLQDNYTIFGLFGNGELNGINNYFCDLTQTEKIQDFIKKIKIQNIVFDGIIFNAGINLSKKKLKEDKIKLLQIVLYSPIYLVTNLLNNISENGKIIFLCSGDCNKQIVQAIKFGLKGFSLALGRKLKNIEIKILDPGIDKEEIKKTDIFSLLQYQDNKLNSILSKIQKTMVRS